MRIEDLPQLTPENGLADINFVPEYCGLFKWNSERTKTIILLFCQDGYKELADSGLCWTCQSNKNLFRVLTSDWFDTVSLPKTIRMYLNELHYCFGCFKREWTQNEKNSSTTLSGYYTEDPDMIELFHIGG